MSAFVRLEDGTWRHRPWWKVAINFVLRAFQPRARKWIVYTVTEGQPPRVLRYGFGPVLHTARCTCDPRSLSNRHDPRCPKSARE